MPTEVWNNFKTVLKIQFSTTDKKSWFTKNVIYKKKLKIAQIQKSM